MAEGARSVEGGLQVYEFLGFREEPDQPNLLLCLRDRNRLTAELLALTVTKLQELQQYFSETLGTFFFFFFAIVIVSCDVKLTLAILCIPQAACRTWTCSSAARGKRRRLRARRSDSQRRWPK